MRLNRIFFTIFIVSLFVLEVSGSENKNQIREWLGEKPKKIEIVKEQKKRIPFIKFRNIELENLFNYLSVKYGINIIIEEPIIRHYRTSMRLRDTSIGEILSIVSKEHSLMYTKKDGTYYITSKQRYHKKRFAFQDLISDSVKIRYASITDTISFLQDIMKGSVVLRSSTKNKPYRNLFDASPDLRALDIGVKEALGKILPQQGEITRSVPRRGSPRDLISNQEIIPKKVLYLIPFSNENKIFFLSTDRELIEKAKGYIKKIDVPIKEVLIQGKIISINVDDKFDLGFDLLGQMTGATEENPLGGGVVVGDIKHTFLDAFTNMKLKLLQSEGKSRTIASPMLLAVNRASARLSLTRETSILTGWTPGKVLPVEGTSTPITIDPAPIYVTKNIGTTLEITPFINYSDEILLNIKITTSVIKPNSQRIILPDETEPKFFDGVDETTIETTLITRSGQGIVLGGLINEAEAKRENKIPILGDIPLLGFLFKESMKDETTRSELIIILTPHIINKKNQDAQAVVDSTRRSIAKERNILKYDEATLDSKKIIDNVLDKDTLEIKKSTGEL